MAAFALAVSALCAGLVGLMPAVRGARAVLQATLREGSLTATGTASRLLFRRALVALEVGLTVMLLLGAGLMLRSFSQLSAVDPGFKAEGLFTASLSLPQRAYPEDAQVETFYSTLIERLSRTPGVTSVTAGSTVPLAEGAGNWDFEVEGRPAPAPGQPKWNAKAVIVLPGYFETLAVPIVRGRSFTAEDHGGSQPVTVISAAMVARYFPGEDPIGRRIRVFGQTTPQSWMSIVGVSGDVLTEGLDADAPPAYHFLHSQLRGTLAGTARSLSLLVRTAPGTGSDIVMPAIRTAVRELDPSLALYGLQTVDEVVQQSVSRPRFTTLCSRCSRSWDFSWVPPAFTACWPTPWRDKPRRSVFDGRSARSAGRLAGQMLTQGMVPVALGLAIGLVASYWASQFWSTQLFKVSTTDPYVYALVAVNVLIVALVAMAVPVRRALRVSPLVALRSE